MNKWNLIPFVVFALATIVIPAACELANVPIDHDSDERIDIVMPNRGICAHRGASATHPENTIAAFEQAIRLKSAMIEFDVYQTKDDLLVVIHDETVDRTTNGSGNVSEMTLAEIRELDAGSWKGASFRGQRVPTLAESLRMMPRNIWLNVHMKYGDDLGTLVAEEIIRHKREHQAVMMCESAQHAAQARAVSEMILVGGFIAPDGSLYDGIDEIKEPFMLQIYGGYPQQVAVAQLRNSDIRVNYCCTDDPGAVQGLFDMGVQYILVDRVEPMIKAAAAAE